MVPEGKSPRFALEKLIDPVQAFALYHFLDAHGLAVSLQEPPLRSALGEIPYLEAPITLFLHDARQMRQARELIRLYRQEPPPVRGLIWRCSCGEEHEPEFGSCWNCGAPKP
jgi:hypothetical protein